MPIRVKREHIHSAVTVRAIRRRGGVPYEVERQVCADCRRLLGEKPLKRAAA
jgi:NMD protein affecting ribosome stability and mRNA decay